MPSSLPTRVRIGLLLLVGLLAGPVGAQNWRQLPGSAVDVAVGANGTAWVVGTNPVPGGYGLHQWTGNSWVPVDGGAVRVALDPRGQAWVVNNRDEIHVREAEGWRRLPGLAKDIAIGPEGTVWALAANRVPGGYGLQRWNGGGWDTLEGGAVRMAVDPRGQPWIVNESGNIYRRDGAGWRPVPGAARDLAISKEGVVWMLSTRAASGGQGLARWNGSGWSDVDGGGVQLAVGPDGLPWVVSNQNHIFQRTEAGPAAGGLAGRWRELPGPVSDIDVGANGAVWAIGTQVAAGGYGILQWTNGNWTPVDGGAVRIAVDPRGQPWVLNDRDEIHVREGGQWRRQPGLGRDIAIGADGSVWLIGANRLPGGYGIYRWNGSNWDSVDGGAVRLAVDPRGQAWIVNDKGGLSVREGGSWRALAGTVRDIGIGANGAVWALGMSSVAGGHNIASLSGSQWVDVEGGATQIAVGPDGQPWLVNNLNTAYQRVSTDSSVAAATQPPSAGQWRELRGAATDIGVGAQGEVWILGTNAVPGGYGLYQAQRNGWTAVGGAGGVRLAVDPRGLPWLVTNKDEILAREAKGWRKMPGLAKDIGVGADGSVWVVGANRVPGGFGVHRWNGQSWDMVDGGAVRIAVDPRGQPWIVNDAGSIYIREGSTWRQLPGTARDIGIGADGAVWVVQAKALQGGHAIARWTGNNWAEVDGGASHIAVGPQGTPWVVNNRNSIFVRQ